MISLFAKPKTEIDNPFPPLTCQSRRSFSAPGSRAEKLHLLSQTMIIVNKNSFTLPLLPLQKGKQEPKDGIAEKDRVFVRLRESID